MINVSNFTCKNNPLRRLGSAAGPTRPRGPAELAEAGELSRVAARRTCPDDTRPGRLRTVALAGQIMLSWLAAIPARLGDRLFTMNDTEAYWRDWQIIKTRGGLVRGYRDPSFDLLAACPKCRGTGRAPDLPCPPCLGTGRVEAKRG